MDSNQARSRGTGEGYLYFIAEDPPGPFCDNDLVVKIGFSKHPKKRLKSLQTGNPRQLSIVLLFKCQQYKLLEEELHATIRQSADWPDGFSQVVRGEWFCLSEIMLNAYLLTIADWHLEGKYKLEIVTNRIPEWRPMWTPGMFDWSTITQELSKIQEMRTRNQTR